MRRLTRRLTLCMGLGLAACNGARANKPGPLPVELPAPLPGPIPAAANANAPLWPGSPHTRGQRDGAVARGLRFIWKMAEDSEVFAEQADELIWALSSVATTTANTAVRETARAFGQRLAVRWRHETTFTWDPGDVDTLWLLSTTLTAAETLGVRHDLLRHDLEGAIAELPARDWLGFDPRAGPPPTLTFELAGEEACRARGMDGDDCTKVTLETADLDVFYDAMIGSYFTEAFGVSYSTTLEHVLHWLPQFYPYPTLETVGEEKFYDVVYLVTHVVYTRNGYGARRLSPVDYADELAFLLDNFSALLRDNDGETFAELVDTLKSFGITPEVCPSMAEAITRLLDTQNQDGSWGGNDLDDPYDRYHTTLTAIDALRDYRFGLQ